MNHYQCLCTNFNVRQSSVAMLINDVYIVLTNILLSKPVHILLSKPVHCNLYTSHHRLKNESLYQS